MKRPSDMVFGLERFDGLPEWAGTRAETDIVERRYPVECPQIVEVGFVLVAPPCFIGGGIAIFEPARAGLEQVRPAGKRTADVAEI